MIQEISPATLATTYLSQLVCDFPHEAVTRGDIDNVTRVGLSSSSYLYQEDGITKAYAYLIDSGDYLYCCFLAVFPGHRGQGVGTQFFTELLPQFAGRTAVVAEVEDPAGAETVDDRRIREKRIRFYEHLGFHVPCDIEFLSSGVPYRLAILAIGEEPCSSVDAAEAVCRIYRAAWDSISAIPAAYRTISAPPNPHH